MFRGKVCSSVKDVHQHSLPRGSAASEKQEQGADERGKSREQKRTEEGKEGKERKEGDKQQEKKSKTRGSFQVDIHGHSYHYYHTNQVKTQLTSTNIQKYYNIHCWLDNVVKNANSVDPESDFESDCQGEAEPDSLLVGDDYTCSAHLDQRYTPHVASVRSKSAMTDHKETLSRQEKIKTLKALITKHEKSTRKERLKRKKLEQVRNMHCGLKAFRKQDPGFSPGNIDHQQNCTGNYTNEQNIPGLGISARE